MADAAIPLPADGNAVAEPSATIPTPPIQEYTPKPSKPARPNRQQVLNKLYALPAPLRTFPLPTFVPHNPLSLFHILYAWVSQAINTQSSAFNPLYQGWFSPETSSVHVTDNRSIRGLWEQGFYGKGSLSRSEPNWLKGEKEKRAKGQGKAKTSEENTRRRRAERQQVKWERARVQKEAIDQKILEEAASATNHNPELAINENSLPLEPASEFVIESSSLALNFSDEPLSIAERRSILPPVGPLELLLLPNSADDVHPPLDDIDDSIQTQTSPNLVFPELPHMTVVRSTSLAPVGPLELLSLPNSIETVSLDESNRSVSSSDDQLENGFSTNIHEGDSALHDLMTNGNGSAYHKTNGHTKLSPADVILGERDAIKDLPLPNGIVDGIAGLNGNAHFENQPLIPGLKRQKSVRFSPTVEQNTFMESEPPSPPKTIDIAATSTIIPSEPVVEQEPMAEEKEPVEFKDQEHTQLTLIEAFFLSYSLGALNILDTETQSPISNKDLFDLFRRTSYFPPLSDTAALSPDDPFMINYVVYHHFRSLGWVVRPGIKFAVDYMLYVRGPVFTHAQYAVIILPSYSDPYYDKDAAAKTKERRTWAWMSSVNRVITQVKKTLLVVYVDIPKPLSVEEELELGINGVLQRYKVREIVMSRWVSNRQKRV